MKLFIVFFLVRQGHALFRLMLSENRRNCQYRDLLETVGCLVAVCHRLIFEHDPKELSLR